MNSFSLGLDHICGVVRNCLIVDGRIGGRGKLGVIMLLVVILVHEEAHQIVNPLLRIVREREEDFRELFVESRVVSVSQEPQNGVKWRRERAWRWQKSGGDHARTGSITRPCGVI